MRNEDDADRLIDLGDAVSETKGTAPVGIVDPLGGYRQSAGFTADD